MGHTGVVLDPNPLEPGLPADALVRAQNAIQDPKQGHGGAVRKRPGLARFNNAWAGGVILGGIPMPVAQFGGAPAAGGGAIVGTGDSDDGSSVGTGDMVGAPGGTFDGGPAATTSGGAPQFNDGTPVFSGARLFVVGRLGTDATVSNEGGSGWYVSTKGLANVATGRTTPGPPIAPYSFPPLPPFDDAWGRPYCIKDNVPAGLYYASAYGNQVLGTTFGAIRTVGVGPMGAAIRRTDGATDALVATLPVNPFGPSAGADNLSGRQIVTVEILSGGTGFTVGDLLFLVGGTGSAAEVRVATVGGGGSVATVTVLGPGAYSVLPIAPGNLTGGNGVGATFNSYTSTAAQRTAITCLQDAVDGNIYVTVKDKFAGQPTALSLGRAFRLVPGTGLLTELTLTPSNDAFLHLPYCIHYFDGYMYVGTFPDAINESALLYRTTGTALVTGENGSFTLGTGLAAFISCFSDYNGRLAMGTGCWMTTPGYARIWSRQPGESADPLVSPWTSLLTASGGAAANGNYFVSMVEFQGALYASWFNPGTDAKIYKIVADSADPLSTSFTVTTAVANPTVSIFPYNLFVDDDLLYAIGVNDATNATRAYVTADGITWTDKSASLPTLATTSRMRPVFFGVNQ